MDNIGRDWPKEVRRGVRLVFWVVLGSALLTCVCSTIVAVFGGDGSGLRWVALVPAVAALLLLGGVYAIAGPIPGIEEIRTADHLRRTLRVCATVAAFGQVARFVAGQIQMWPRMPYLWACERLVEGLTVFLLFIYLRKLAMRFGESRLSRSLGVMACLGALARLRHVLSVEGIAAEFDFSRLGYQVILLSKVAFGLCVGVWALVLLWRFGNRIVVATNDRCFNCGYPHQGLDERRCPECGLSF